MHKYVAHMISEYLGHTLNWVYTQIKYTRNFTPYVLTEKIKNVETYPVDLIFKPRFTFVTRSPFIDRIFRRAGLLPLQNKFCFSRAIRRLPPIVIHAHFGTEGYFALGLKKRFGIPLITRFYGFDVGKLPQISLWRKRYKRLFREGDCFIVEGQNMKSILECIGCPSGKIVVHHLGIELERINYVVREVNSSSLRILIAATFKEKKGIAYALKAIGIARKNLPNRKIELNIIGDGELNAELHKLSVEFGIEDIVKWHGYRPYSELIKAFYLNDIFLSPSVTSLDGDTEGGAPVAIIEAAASGLPVVSTIHGDIPEVVLNGKSGILTHERSAGELADAICILANDRIMRNDFGLRARKHIETNFNAKTQGEELENIYNGFCKNTAIESWG